MSRLGGAVPLLLIVIFGALVGLGGYTFVYARGYSYLLDDPKACVNCHVMRENYDSWIVSSHRQVTCNGCHTPHDPLRKYLVKAENGFAHSWAFTFEDTQVIQIKSHSRAVVQTNCIDCHQNTLKGTFLEADHEAPRCSTCHADVGHTLK